ncbi:MAG: GNAT family N-acetyltransferase [Bacteroidetes bacterium]|nr:MAG: GNAT family N-acetyltransferase [Bacteroidota bacterium]
MLEINNSPFPEIKTEKLILRNLELSDAPEMLFLRSDESVMKYIDRERTRSLEEAGSFIQKMKDSVDKNENIMWVISLKEKPDVMIGYIGYWRIKLQHYRAEVGYALHPAYWNKGIMKEALLAVTQYGFGPMKLHSIEAQINSENIASGKLLEKTGFIKEGYFKEDYFANGRFIDSVVYSLLEK